MYQPGARGQICPQICRTNFAEPKLPNDLQCDFILGPADKGGSPNIGKVRRRG